MIAARQVMTSMPSVCEDLDSVYEAVNIMQMEDCGVVPVVDSQEQLVGVITDRDICMRLVLDRLDPQQTEVGDIMSTDVLTCFPNDDMEQVINSMERKRVRRIVVVDELDHVVGIISEGDIARSGAWPKLPELVQEVVERYVP